VHSWREVEPLVIDRLDGDSVPGSADEPEDIGG
jgi:hypothetical protein